MILPRGSGMGPWEDLLGGSGMGPCVDLLRGAGMGPCADLLPALLVTPLSWSELTDCQLEDGTCELCLALTATVDLVG